MKLQEYQGKKILHSFGIEVPLGIIVKKPDQALIAAEKIFKKTFTNFWVVKAQIHAGGRSKAGGVKIAKSLEEIKKITSDILGIYLITQQTSKKGNLVHKVIIEEYIDSQVYSIRNEFYFSILIDRYKEKTVLIYSPKGGIDIEEIIKYEQEKIFVEEIDSTFGIHKFQIRKIAFNLGLEINKFKEFIIFLYKAYRCSDASLIEINPLLISSNDKIMAVDAKFILDDNAFNRHINYVSMCDLEVETSLEISTIKSGFNFFRFNGNIGCMVNGAGLAMATMDIIKLSGGKPANFLDIGGKADFYSVEKALRLLITYENVSVIFINIFGGIVRCDLIAKAIIAVYQVLIITMPLIVRLQGTNNKKAKKMMDKIGLKIITVGTLKQAAEKIHEVL